MKVFHVILTVVSLLCLSGCGKGPGVISPTVLLNVSYSPDTLRMPAIGWMKNIGIRYEIENPGGQPITEEPSCLSLARLICDSDTIVLYSQYLDTDEKKRQYLDENQIVINPGGVLLPEFRGQEISVQWKWARFNLHSNTVLSVEAAENSTGAKRTMYVFCDAVINAFGGGSRRPLVVIQDEE